MDNKNIKYDFSLCEYGNLMENKNVIIANCSDDIFESVMNKLKKQGANVYKYCEDMPKGLNIDTVICGVDNMSFGLFDKLDEIDFKNAVEKNINYNLKVIKTFINDMIDKRCGTIVNIIPQYTNNTVWGTTCISMVCGAITSFTKALAMDYCKYNVRANCIEYGLGIDENSPVYSDDELIDMQPIRRICTADDIADSVLFLSSDMSAFITGETIPVNGGAFCIGHNQVWRNWLERI